jgi:fatty-acyl-CoA synthase
MYNDLHTVISQNKGIFRHAFTDHIMLLQVQINPANQAPELLHNLTKVGAKALIFSEVYKSNSCYQILRTVVPELDSCPEHGAQLQSTKVPLLQFIIVMGSKQYR